MIGVFGVRRVRVPHGCNWVPGSLAPVIEVQIWGQECDYLVLGSRTWVPWVVVAVGF